MTVGQPTDGGTKRPLSDGHDNVPDGKKIKMTPAVPVVKSAVALLHEYQHGVDFKFLGKSGSEHAPAFTMEVVVDGKVEKKTFYWIKDFTFSI